VRGAQKWVGRARWHYGSFYLWGDVPALMPIVRKHVKVPTMGAGWYPPDHPKHVPGLAFNGHAARNLRVGEGVKNPGFRFDGSGRSFQSESVDRHTKNNGGSWFNIGSPGQKETNRNPVHDGVKQWGDWFNADQPSLSRMYSSKSNARKAASAMIARIPLSLSRHIARAWHP
jgi:hypothetical protein